MKKINNNKIAKENKIIKIKLFYKKINNIKIKFKNCKKNLQKLNLYLEIRNMLINLYKQKFNNFKSNLIIIL